MIIPLFTDTTHFSVDVRLDGTLYSLDLDWNERASLWYLSVYLPTADARVPVATSVPCVCSVPLLAGVHDNAPEGQLVVVGRRDPLRYDWGTQVKLLYLTAAEVAEIGA